MGYVNVVVVVVVAVTIFYILFLISSPPDRILALVGVTADVRHGRGNLAHCNGYFAMSQIADYVQQSEL